MLVPLRTGNYPKGRVYRNRFYRIGGVVAHILQEIIGLALLPAGRIYEGFEVI